VSKLVVHIPFLHIPSVLSFWSNKVLTDRLCGLVVKGSGFDSRLYQIFWELVGLERSPLSLVSTSEELLERKSSGSGLGNRNYVRRDPSRCPRGTLYLQQLTPTSPTNGCRSVGIVRSRTEATELRRS
jgi:hypothetical protein